MKQIILAYYGIFFVVDLLMLIGSPNAKFSIFDVITSAAIAGCAFYCVNVYGDKTLTHVAINWLLLFIFGRTLDS